MLRKYRLMREMTLRIVAKEMGIAAATLMRIEQGQQCDSVTLRKILIYLLEDAA